MSTATPASTLPCYPTVWGGGVALRGAPEAHDLQIQPFWNQDFRQWCRKCGLLFPPANPDPGASS